MKSPIMGMAIGASMIVALASCGGKSTAPAPAAAGPVQVEARIAQLSPFTSGIYASGSVIAGEYVELKTEVSGRIVQLNIQEGQNVAAGTLLLKLNDEDLRAQRKKLETQLDIADKTQRRLKQLLDANGLNQQDYDQAVSQVEGLKADIEYVDAQIRKTEIRAPFSGTIGLRQVSNGAFVTSQQVIASLQQLSPLKVDFVLPESQSGKLNIGSALVLETSTGEKVGAKMLAIEPMVNEGTRNMKARAVITGTSAMLKPGAFVNVLIEGDPNAQSILLPTNVIIPDSRTKKVALIKQGKVVMQVVETGVRTEDKVQIISGINPGDTIAATGLLFLKPDAPVIIRSIQAQ